MSRRLVPMLPAAMACAAALAASSPARAADPDYIGLFRSRVIKCVHSTVNPDKATIEITKGPETKGELTTVRFKTFYDGMIRKNVMETEMMVRQSGSIRQLMIKTLADSGTAIGTCGLEKSWADF